MPYVVSQKQKIHYSVEGERGAWLVLHAPFGETLDCWRRLGYLEEFERHYRVIMIDPLGQGRSQASEVDECYDIKSRSQHVLDILEELRPGRVNYVGFGLGAMVGYQLAIDAPQRMRSMALAGAHPYPITPEMQKVEEVIGLLSGQTIKAAGGQEGEVLKGRQEGEAIVGGGQEGEEFIGGQEGEELIGGQEGEEFIGVEEADPIKPCLEIVSDEKKKERMDAYIDLLKAEGPMSEEREAGIRQADPVALARALTAMGRWPGVGPRLRAIRTPTVLFTDTREDIFLAIREAGRSMPQARYHILPELLFADGMLEADSLMPHLMEFLKRQRNNS